MEFRRGGPLATSVGNSGRTAPTPVSLAVKTTIEADAQIREIDDWWRRNRVAATDLFLDELTASFDIIGHTPQIGRFIDNPQYRGHGAYY
ncbi:MAG: hypothetical protein ACRD2A_25345 [Vicinamibacterales bacterium]